MLKLSWVNLFTYQPSLKYSLLKFAPPWDKFISKESFQNLNNFFLAVSQRPQDDTISIMLPPTKKKLQAFTESFFTIYFSSVIQTMLSLSQYTGFGPVLINQGSTYRSERAFWR